MDAGDGDGDGESTDEEEDEHDDDAEAERINRLEEFKSLPGELIQGRTAIEELKQACKL